jgi:hypothetical protein
MEGDIDASRLAYFLLNYGFIYIIIGSQLLPE